MDPKEMQKALDTANSTLDDVSIKLKDANKSKTEAEAKIVDLTVSLKDADQKREAAEKKVTEQEAEIVTLRADKAKRAEEDLANRVDIALADHPKKGEVIGKDLLLLHLKSNPEKFEKDFPRIEPSKRYLTQNLTDNKKDAQRVTMSDTETSSKTVDLASLAVAYARQHGVSLEDAQRRVLLAHKK